MSSQILQDKTWQELKGMPWQDVDKYAQTHNIVINESDPMKRKAAIISAVKNGFAVIVAPEEKAANPEEVIIEDFPMMPANSEVNFSPLNLENLGGCVFHDKDGNPELINIPKAVSIIIEVFHPKSFSDNEILVYEHGVYNRGGKEIIVKALNDAFSKFTDGKGNIIYNKYTKSEILRCIVDGSHVKPEDFDNNLDIINMKNGLYNWKTGEFKNHDPDYLSIIQIPVVYDESAECFNIDKMFKTVARSEDITKLYEFIGYLLYKGYPLQKILILLGPGNTGKSIFLNLINYFIGKANSSSVAMQEFSSDKYASSDLYGKMANICGDLDQSSLKHGGLLKKLTSDTDPIRAQRKGKPAFDFINRAKLIFSANKLPSSEDTTTGFFRRFEIVPFLHVFTSEEFDKKFLDSLTSQKELSGLFNKVVKLLPDLIKRNTFTNQMSIEDARQVYNEMSNTEESFFDKFVKETPGRYCSKDVLYNQYKLYCETLKVPCLTKNKFGRYITQNIDWVKRKIVFDGKKKANFGTHINNKSVAAWPDTYFDDKAFRKSIMV